MAGSVRFFVGLCGLEFSEEFFQVGQLSMGESLEK